MNPNTKSKFNIKSCRISPSTLQLKLTSSQPLLFAMSVIAIWLSENLQSRRSYQQSLGIERGKTRRLTARGRESKGSIGSFRWTGEQPLFSYIWTKIWTWTWFDNDQNTIFKYLFLVFGGSLNISNQEWDTVWVSPEEFWTVVTIIINFSYRITKPCRGTGRWHTNVVIVLDWIIPDFWQICRKKFAELSINFPIQFGIAGIVHRISDIDFNSLIRYSMKSPFDMTLGDLYKMTAELRHY